MPRAGEVADEEGQCLSRPDHYAGYVFGAETREELH